jgi:hypothetical protein
MPLHALESLTVALVLAATLVACGKAPVANDVSPAAGAAQASNIASSTTLVVSADPTKSGEAFAEEMEHNPTLFAKQKEICHGRGPSFQSRQELQAPCAAWDIARRNLEIDQPAEGGVKNTNSL